VVALSTRSSVLYYPVWHMSSDKPTFHSFILIKYIKQVCRSYFEISADQRA